MILGYGKQEMNQAEVLCHSSGPWKKHKYFQKIGEGANAVYKYAKNDAADDAKDFYKKHVTGDEYKGRELAAKENAKNDQHLAENAANEGRTEAANRGLKESERYGRMAAKAEHDYYTKSLKGISESAPEKAKSTVAKGEKLLKEFFSSETKKTVKDTFTGETRTPKQTGDDVVNIKKLANKKK